MSCSFIVIFMMGFKKSTIPQPILRFEATNEELEAKGVDVTSNLKEIAWSEDTIKVIKSLVPLISEENGKFKVKYNFTHLSNILNIPKVDIYTKLIEIYNEKDKTAQIHGNNQHFQVDQSVSPNTSIPFPRDGSIKFDHSTKINTLFRFDEVESEGSSDDDNSHSGVNLNMASGFLHRNKLDPMHSLILQNDNDEDDDHATSLESLLLEEEVLKQI